MRALLFLSLFSIWLFNNLAFADDFQLPPKLSDLHLFSNLERLIPRENVFPYDVNFPLWSDGAEKQRWVYLPNNQKIKFNGNSPWEFPVGTVLIKQFDFDRRIETRIEIKTNEGWQFSSYRWNVEQTDATRVDAVTPVQVTSKATARPFTWKIPSSNQCVLCHMANGADGSVRGINTQQFGSSQLRTWISQNHFENPPVDLRHLDFFPDLHDSDEQPSREKLARGYLAVNCASCHRPGSFVPTDMDLSWGISLREMNIVSKAPMFGGMGVTGSQLIYPGDKKKSILWLRMKSTTGTHMPYIGAIIPDESGLTAIGNWIDSLLN